MLTGGKSSAKNQKQGRGCSQPPEIKPSRSYFGRMTNVFRKYHRGSCESASDRFEQSNTCTKAPEIKPSRSGFDVAKSFFKKMKETQETPRQVPRSQDQQKRHNHGSRTQSSEPCSKNTAPVGHASSDAKLPFQQGNCHPTLLTSIRSHGAATPSFNHNMKCYPTLPVTGVATMLAEENQLDCKQLELGYIPFEKAPNSVKNDIKKSLDNVKQRLSQVGEGFFEPIGLVMTHKTFFDNARGARVERWEQAVRDWEALGPQTRSWDWVRDHSYTELARLSGSIGATFLNRRNRDAVIARDQEERSYWERRACGQNSFEDAITNLILKNTMFYCGQAEAETKIAAESTFQKEREDKLMVPQAEKGRRVVEVARERKFNRSEHHVEQRAREFESAAHVDQQFLAWLVSINDIRGHSHDAEAKKAKHDGGVAPLAGLSGLLGLAIL